MTDISRVYENCRELSDKISQQLNSIDKEAPFGLMYRYTRLTRFEYTVYEFDYKKMDQTKKDLIKNNPKLCEDFTDLRNGIQKKWDKLPLKIYGTRSNDISVAKQILKDLEGISSEIGELMQKLKGAGLIAKSLTIAVLAIAGLSIYKNTPPEA